MRISPPSGRAMLAETKPKRGTSRPSASSWRTRSGRPSAPPRGRRAPPCGGGCRPGCRRRPAGPSGVGVGDFTTSRARAARSRGGRRVRRWCALAEAMLFSRLQINRTDVLPGPPTLQWKLSPALTGTSGDCEPTGSRRRPSARCRAGPAWLASQATALTGTCTAAPHEVLTISPFFEHHAGEREVERARAAPRRAEREHAAARVVGDGVLDPDLPVADAPGRRSRSTASRSRSRAAHRQQSRQDRQVAAEHERDLGLGARRDELAGVHRLALVEHHAESRMPKSGWSTPSMSITTLLVTPIFLPITVSPASVRRWIMRCWMR